MDDDVLTVLLAEDGKRATKTHTRTDDGWRTEGYDSGWLFEVIESAEFDSAGELAIRLEVLSQIENALVVRGRLTDDLAVDGERRRSDGWVRRLLYEKIDEDGEVWPAAFTDCDRRWICIDIDEAPAGTGREPRDYDLCVQWICRNYVPDWLAMCDVVYQWSASSGVRPWDTLSIHLWYMLDRPVCSASLREWFTDNAERWPYVDRRLFNPVQVHYVADPIFLGAHDPIPNRIGLLEGDFRAAEPPDEILNLADWRDLKAERDAERRRRNEILAQAANQRGVRSHNARIRYAQATRAGKCQDILNARKGDRHHTIVRCGHHLGGLVASGYLDRQETIEMLIDAGQAAYEQARRVKDVPRIVRDAVENGEAEPYSLDHIGADRETRARVNGSEPGPGASQAAEKFRRKKVAAAGPDGVRCKCGWSGVATELVWDRPSFEWLCPECGASPFETREDRLIATGYADYGRDPTEWPPLMRDAYVERFGAP